MYKIKLFSGEKTDLLQNTINEWLQMNKDILIHESNLSGSNGESLGSNEYVFYILYASTDEKNEALKEMAATVTQNQSVEVKEINPQIMEPSS
jgi:hypothetical protein